MTFDLTSRRLAAAGAALLLAMSASAARAGTIYDATGGAENGGDPISTATGVGPVAADRFVAPSNVGVTSVTLNLSLSGAPVGGFIVELFADTGAGPGASVGFLGFVSDASLTSSFALYTFPTAPISLSSGQSYYVGVLDAGSAAILGNTLDPAVLGRGPVAAGGFYYNNGGVQANAGGPYEVAIEAAPEPTGAALALTGLVGLAAARLTGRRGAARV